jgi:UDP-N-acetylglucosamine--N-acetylmuramyl-(pentapeptide) pyrophosphoryl-undecaprenol N-acetylglucosamine transferase
LIPYPFASGDHQRKNAEALQACGAAICLPNFDATVERLSEWVTVLLSDRARLSNMAQAARAFGRPLAADDIAHDFLALAGLEPSGKKAGSTGAERSLLMPYGEVA